jgi:hypothetical protein
MQIDPAAALALWAVDVDLVDRVYTIPALPASEWVLAILAGSWADIVPGLIADRDDLDDLILDGEVTSADCEAAARDALAAASGLKWWTAVRLARAAAETWIGSELALRGLDPSRMPLGAYLAATYRAAAREMEDSKRAQLDMELDRPPKGVSAAERFDETAAADAFMELAARGQ